MNYMGLSSKQLSRFSHHWFWGICIDKRQDDNLHLAALGLQQNPELRKAMDEKIQRINQRHWFISSLYWLTNYNQYRLNYYQLQGYWSLQLYNKVQKMFEENMFQKTGPVEAGEIVAFAVAGALAVKYLAPTVLSSLSWFSNKIMHHISKKNIKAVPDTPEQKTPAPGIPLPGVDVTPQQNTTRPIVPQPNNNFIIDENMLKNLRILGINSQVKESISFDTLKAAYKAARLRTHPDKTGGANSEAFVEVNNAYNQLIEQIHTNLLPATNSTSTRYNFFEKIDEIKKDLADLRVEQELARKEMEELSADFKEISRRSKIQYETALAQNIELKAFLANAFPENEIQPGVR